MNLSFVSTDIHTHGRMESGYSLRVYWLVEFHFLLVIFFFKWGISFMHHTLSSGTRAQMWTMFQQTFISAVLNMNSDNISANVPPFEPYKLVIWTQDKTRIPNDGMHHKTKKEESKFHPA